MMEFERIDLEFILDAIDYQLKNDDSLEEYCSDILSCLHNRIAPVLQSLRADHS